LSGTLNWAVGVLTLIGIYAILAMIMNFQAGWGGLWDLGLGGLLAAGGYFFVLATLTDDTAQYIFSPGWPIWIGIIGAGVFTALVAFLTGLPAIRLRGEYFLIVTLAFAEMARQLVINEERLANSTTGITELERPFASSVSAADYRYLLCLAVLVLVVATYVLMRRIGHSPYGRLLRSCRDNEVLALAVGKRVTRRRHEVRIFAGFLFGLAAVLYIWHIRAVVPPLFGPDVTFTTWIVLVVGGFGSVGGGILGAALLVGITEALLFIPVSAERADLMAGSRPFLLGLALILILRLRSDGIVPERWTFRWQEEQSGALRDRLHTLVGKGSATTRSDG
jgi:branched-chain amino acid transport system permease protein